MDHEPEAKLESSKYLLVMEDEFLKPGLDVTPTQVKTQEMQGSLCLPEQRDIGLLC